MVQRIRFSEKKFEKDEKVTLFQLMDYVTHASDSHRNDEDFQKIIDKLAFEREFLTLYIPKTTEKIFSTFHSCNDPNLVWGVKYPEHV